MNPIPKTTKDIAERLLRDYERLRDDDLALMMNVWWQEYRRHFNLDDNHESREVFKVMPAYELFKHIRSKILSSPESIKRTRQKIQQQKPHLLGGKRKAKLDLAEQVRISMRYL